MKHYIDKTTNEIYAYESDGSQDEYIKGGLVPISDADFAILRESLTAPEELFLQMQAALEAKVQELLDSQARSMNFDNILSGISNASLPIGEYRQTDGAALLLWRARVWEKAAEIRDAFLAGQRPEPTWEEVKSELPSYPIAA